MTAAQEPLFAESDIPKPPTVANDWGVEVNEIRIFATGMGADWWLLFSARFETTPRMTCLAMVPMGGVWHVACDTREDAEWFADAMVEHGAPRAAVKVRRLAQCKRYAAPVGGQAKLAAKAGAA